MKTFYITDTGKVREHNEDSVTIVNNNNGEYLMAVADGMGGHRAGEVASNLAIKHLENEFFALDTIGSKTDAVIWIKQMVDKINELIIEYSEKYPDSKGLGTTLVVAIVTKEYILVGNIGDSSGFAMKDNKLYKVTHDHTLVNLLAEAGKLTEEEAANHPKKNILMKALGALEEIDIDVFDVDMNVDKILLCSDGLTNLVSIDQIEKILNSDVNYEDQVIRLVKKANNRGGIDNISVAYLIREDGDYGDSKGAKD